jgi:hypothetical protein
MRGGNNLLDCKKFTGVEGHEYERIEDHCRGSAVRLLSHLQEREVELQNARYLYNLSSRKHSGSNSSASGPQRSVRQCITNCETRILRTRTYVRMRRKERGEKDRLSADGNVDWRSVFHPQDRRM